MCPATGTDASVFLELRGEQRSSGSVPLASTEAAAFERGAADVFTLRLPRLGRLAEAVVGHDGALAGLLAAGAWGRVCWLQDAAGDPRCGCGSGRESVPICLA